MPTKTIIYRYCISKENHDLRQQKLLKKELKRKFKATLKALDTSTLETQETVLKALL